MNRLLFWGVGWFLDSVAHCIFQEIAAQTSVEIILFKVFRVIIIDTISIQYLNTQSLVYWKKLFT